MSLHCFAIGPLDPGADQDAFNAFCAARWLALNAALAT